MQFIIKQISPSRKEIRISFDSVEINGMEYYLFGNIDDTFDEGSILSKYIPKDNANYYSPGPNPAIIRLVVAYFKDTLGSPNGFKDTLLTFNNKSIPKFATPQIHDIPGDWFKGPF